MEFLNTYANYAFNTDLTGINIDLPDELKEEIAIAFNSLAYMATKVAIHIYGDGVTEENYQEAMIIMAMVYRQMTGHDKPLELG